MISPIELLDFERNALGYGWRQHSDRHNIPGYIITKKILAYNRVLTFSLKMSNIASPKTISGMALKVIYLLSYENMGAIKILICGKYFRDITTSTGSEMVDSLYSPLIAHRNVSVPFLFETILSDSFGHV